MDFVLALEQYTMLLLIKQLSGTDNLTSAPKRKMSEMIQIPGSLQQSLGAVRFGFFLLV